MTSFAAFPPVKALSGPFDLLGNAHFLPVDHWHPVHVWLLANDLANDVLGEIGELAPDLFSIPVGHGSLPIVT